MKTLKKIIAGTSIVATLAMSTAFAAQIGTITGGTGTTVDPTDAALPTSTGSTQVTVTANVAPTLSMSLNTDSIAFGNLIPGTPNAKSVVLTTATNAENGISIDMAAQGLASSTKSIGNLVKAGTSPATGSGTYEVNSATNAGGTPFALNNVASNQKVLDASDVTESNAATTVTLTATADALTEAGNYGDTLTFTVTGNF